MPKNPGRQVHPTASRRLLRCRNFNQKSFNASTNVITTSPIETTANAPFPGRQVHPTASRGLPRCAHFNKKTPLPGTNVTADSHIETSTRHTLKLGGARFTPQQADDSPAAETSIRNPSTLARTSSRLPILKPRPTPFSENQVHPTASRRLLRCAYFNRETPSPRTNVTADSHIEPRPHPQREAPGSPHSKQKTPPLLLLQ